MLNNNDIKNIEQIICYQFNDKQLLIKLFDQPLVCDHEAYNNGLMIFESFIRRECNNPIFNINKYYQNLDENGKVAYIKELFESEQTNNFYSSLKKIGLAKYLNFNESTSRQTIYDFVFCLFNAIAIDCKNEDWSKLSLAINKITLFNYAVYYPNFEYDKLNIQFVRSSYQCKSAIMQINCPKFLTYWHQEVNETFNYLAYYYVDLMLSKTENDYIELKDIWKNIDFTNDVTIQFEEIAKSHHLNTGYLYFHDDYYWYCFAFASKFSLAFFAKSERKEEATELAVTAFIKHYAQLDNEDENELVDDGKAIDITTLFFSFLSLELDLHHYDKNKPEDINWKDMNKNHLIHQLNDSQIFSLQIFQEFTNHINCLLFVHDIPIAFSANGSNEIDALANTCELLIKHYTC